MNNLPALRPNAAVGDSKTGLQLFQAFEKQIAQIVPQHLRPEVLMNAVINSCRKLPKLYQCHQGSMLSALLHCGTVGWVPDTPSQECHLIPFGNEVVVIGGYRGFIKLVRNSGAICNVVSRVVYSGDKFDYELGSNPKIVHIPKLVAEEQVDGDILYVYSQIWWNDPNVYPRDDFEVMSKAQVDKILTDIVKKNRGKMPDPWKYHFSEQARKTVIKRHMKRLPMSPEMAHASDLDNRAVTIEPQPLHQIVRDMVEAAEKTTGDRLADDLDDSPEGAGSDMDVAKIKEWIDQHRSQLPSKELEQIESELEFEPENLTVDGLKDIWDRLQALK